MRNRWCRRPELEPLESLTLLSAVPTRVHSAAALLIVPGTKVAPSSATLLNGTIDGTFFAHGSAATGRASTYSLFASGRIAPVGPVLLVGGFQTSGGSVRGNLLLELKSIRGGTLNLRLTAVPGAAGPGDYTFAYRITHSSGAGTVEIALRPVNTNVHGRPVSNPGFFGNATLTFRSATPTLA